MAANVQISSLHFNLPPPQAVHPSLAQPPAIQQEKLSSTNLYIRGLSRVCSDEDLVTLCKQ